MFQLPLTSPRSPLGCIGVAFEIFAIPRIASDEKNNSFQNFRNWRQSWEEYWNFENFFPRITVPIAFPPGISTIFRLNNSPFGNSTIFGFSGNFPRKIPYHLSRKFPLNGKLSRHNEKILYTPLADEIVSIITWNLLHDQYWTIFIYQVLQDATFQENTQITLA